MGKSDLRKIPIILLTMLLTVGNLTTAYADSTRKMVITATVSCNKAEKKKEPDEKAGAAAVSVNEPVTQTGGKDPTFSAGVKGTASREITEPEYITDKGPKECRKENKTVVNKDALFILLIILVVAVISRLLMKGTAGHEKKGFA